MDVLSFLREQAAAYPELQQRFADLEAQFGDDLWAYALSALPVALAEKHGRDAAGRILASNGEALRANGEVKAPSSERSGT